VRTVFVEVAVDKDLAVVVKEVTALAWGCGSSGKLMVKVGEPRGWTTKSVTDLKAGQTFEFVSRLDVLRSLLTEGTILRFIPRDPDNAYKVGLARHKTLSIRAAEFSCTIVLVLRAFLLLNVLNGTRTNYLPLGIS
jgi:hypothetical protein